LYVENNPAVITRGVPQSNIILAPNATYLISHSIALVSVATVGGFTVTPTLNGTVLPQGQFGEAAFPLSRLALSTTYIVPTPAGAPSTFVLSVNIIGIAAINFTGEIAIVRIA
jgi:hypothetical protein